MVRRLSQKRPVGFQPIGVARQDLQDGSLISDCVAELGTRIGKRIVATTKAGNSVEGVLDGVWGIRIKILLAGGEVLNFQITDLKHIRVE